MATHHFEVEDAIQCGVEKAVLLYNLRFWLDKVRANDKDRHKHDGYYWTYNSAKAFGKLFPYYTERKIHRMLEQLEEAGLVISGNYNKVAYDRTKWYTMPDFSICQNCQMETTKVVNGITQSVEPIPDSNPDSNPDVNTNTNVSAKKEKSTKFKPVKPDEVSEQIWNDLLILRKETKASNTKTAWTTVFNGLEKAQQATGHSLDQIITFWIGKAWKGFNADWYLNAQPKPQQTNYQGNNHANHQSANSQPKSKAEQYRDMLNQQYAERYGQPQPTERTVN